MTDSVSESNGTDLRSSRRTSDTASSIDRLPPHSIDAEQGVLGCQLLDPRQCITEVTVALGDGVEASYFDLRHQVIQRALLDMHEANEAIDLITLQQHLKDKNLLEQVGGIPYLMQLQSDSISAAMLPSYLEILREKWLLRKMIQVCSGVVGRIYEHEGEVDVLMDEVEASVLAVNRSRQSQETESMTAMVRRGLDNVEQMFQRKGEISGLATGFPDLDKMTDGLHGGEMIVIAARPSLGKTSIGMNIAEHVALELGQPVGVFSLEMSKDQLMLRLFASVGRVNLRGIRDGVMGEADFPRLMTASGRLAAAKMHIDDTPGLSVMQLRARARRMRQQHGVKLFVIDYLQLLHSTSEQAKRNREREIADISAGIKALAKELNVPVIVLSQLSRELEKDKKHRKPRLSDIRESGSIEQDADLVGLLYKPHQDDEEDDEPVEKEAEAVNLLVAKQRNGPTGDVRLTMLKPYFRFESRSAFSDEDVPQNNV